MLRACSSQPWSRAVSARSIMQATSSTVKAMVKAMLNSPTCDANGYSNLFCPSDFASLKSNGNHKAAATAANDWMVAAEHFLAAYGYNIDPVVRNKLQNTLEVRAVMLVQNKKTDTRRSFATIEEIAREFHEDCKREDPKIPAWNRLPQEHTSKEPAANTVAAKGLREIGLSVDGLIDDSLLLEKGFKKDQTIKHAKTGELCTITALDANKKTVTCTPKVAEEKSQKVSAKAAQAKKVAVIHINRADLLRGAWVLHKEIKPKFLTDIASPIDNFEYKANVVAGIVKNAITLEFMKSSEADCVIQTSPDTKVFCTKAKKIGALKLVGISNCLTICPTAKDVGPSWKVIGRGDDFKNVIKPCSNSVPAGAVSSLAPRPFIAKFWSVRETFDQAVVNCEYKPKLIEVSYFGKKLNIEVPVMVNSASIPDEGEVIVLKETPTKEPEMPAPKKRRSK